MIYEGYATGYTPYKVRDAASRLIDLIHAAKSRANIDTFVVHGNSGVSAGFAALMLGDFNLVLVRKDNDNSHGLPLEGPDGHVMRRYMILDDFVATGATVRRIYDKVKTLHRAKVLKVPELCGVLCYGSGRAHSVPLGDGGYAPVMHHVSEITTPLLGGDRDN